MLRGKRRDRETRTNGRESISHLVGVSLSFARAQERESDYVHRPLFLPSPTIQIPSYLDKSRSRKKYQRGKKPKDRKVGPYNAYPKKAKKSRFCAYLLEVVLVMLIVRHGWLRNKGKRARGGGWVFLWLKRERSKEEL